MNAGSFSEYVQVLPRSVWAVATAPASAAGGALALAADPVQVAALVNPVMASWMALSVRTEPKPVPGFSVLILGVTGVSGRVAVKVAQHFGAATIIGSARAGPRLAAAESWGATSVIPLDDLGDPKHAAALSTVDVVLDFVWGAQAGTYMSALAAARHDAPGRPLQFLQIGNTAPGEPTVPAAALRSVNLRIVGSGFGAFSPAELARETPLMVKAIVEGGWRADVSVYGIGEVEKEAVWNGKDTERVVFTADLDVGGL
ncbi:hypothetical protein HDU93_000727 [Gonapodya sp. JEL0774]|nr:hypothetical protein HDU93_000727 [Gonapodya sp. JEL0774]